MSLMMMVSLVFVLMKKIVMDLARHGFSSGAHEISHRVVLAAPTIQSWARFDAPLRSVRQYDKMCLSQYCPGLVPDLSQKYPDLSTGNLYFKQQNLTETLRKPYGNLTHFLVTYTYVQSYNSSKPTTNINRRRSSIISKQK